MRKEQEGQSAPLEVKQEKPKLPSLVDQATSEIKRQVEEGAKAYAEKAYEKRLRVHNPNLRIKRNLLKELNKKIRKSKGLELEELLKKAAVLETKIQSLEARVKQQAEGLRKRAYEQYVRENLAAAVYDVQMHESRPDDPALRQRGGRGFEVGKMEDDEQ